MLNRKEAEVLTYLIKRSPSNSYIVIEPSEILENISFKLEKDELMQLLTDLSSREAINVRIINLDECVLAPTPKAKVLLNEMHDMEKIQQVVAPIVSENHTPQITEVVKDKPGTMKKRFTRKSVGTVQPIPVETKVIINYRRIFWAAFTGAIVGGALMGLLMIVINLAV